jgi:hypothetical protein
VQPNEPSGRVVKCFRHRGKDLEAKRAPERDRDGVRFDHGVELHCGVAVSARHFEDVRAESTSDAASIYPMTKLRTKASVSLWDAASRTTKEGPAIGRGREPHIPTIAARPAPSGRLIGEGERT